MPFIGTIKPFIKHIESEIHQNFKSPIFVSPPIPIHTYKQSSKKNTQNAFAINL